MEEDCRTPTMNREFLETSGQGRALNSYAWKLLVPEDGPPQPAYVPPRARHGTNLWNVYSPRLCREVFLYSQGEYNHWILIESCPQVLWYCEQYPKVTVNIEGTFVTTRFDMLLCYADNTLELREVKRLNDCDEAITERTLRQLNAQAFWADKIGISYKVVTEKEILSSPLYLSNWQQILSYLRGNQNYNIQDSIVMFVAANPCCKLKTILNVIKQYDQQTTLLNVFALLHKGILVAPLNAEKLSTEIEIKRRSD